MKGSVRVGYYLQTGHPWVLVVIVEESRSRFRIRLRDGDDRVLPLGGRRRLVHLVSHWVPKRDIHEVGLGAVLWEIRQ